MNPKLVEFALRKQRLQIRAAHQRGDLLQHLHGIEAMLGLVDRAQDQARWAREHVPLLSAAVLLVALFKPRATFRLARRAWVGWILVKKTRQRLAPLLGALERARGLAPRG